MILPALAKISNEVEVVIRGGKRCFTANGIPDHPTGKFPNRSNPNAIREQQIDVCVTLEPIKRRVPTPINSRQGDPKWSLEIFGAPGKLGLDFNNGHVGRGDLYHYHGIARDLIKNLGSSMVGYAGDGFEIHYLPAEKKSGWTLKQGMRPLGGPPGVYSGLYNEDFEYVGGKNRLDQCNGGYLYGNYAYFLTDDYPFLPRCLYGKIRSDFDASRHR